MAEWKWISKRALLLLHGESLVEHGGAPGMRDEGLLASALMRPQQLLSYGEPDFAGLAAAYACGIARNHPFVDGNKRAALLAAGMFLMLNGHRLQASQADVVLTIRALAAGDLEESSLASWIREHAIGQ